MNGCLPGERWLAERAELEGQFGWGFTGHHRQCLPQGDVRCHVTPPIALENKAGRSGALVVR